ncbi:MAG: class II fumarate hydratase [Pseudomonadales bacterium]
MSNKSKNKNLTKSRIERDSLGALKVPSAALYGAQTQRAVDNFPVSGLPLPRAFIRALGLIKASAAKVNADLGLLPKLKAKAIIYAAEQIAAGRFDEQFPIDVFQTGSGTSSNMNANEVIATLAGRQLKDPVHPNDDVNAAQSSNDVIPTAIHLSAALLLQEQLLPALTHLQKTIDQRAKELKGVIKTGRTHLMDAMPIELAQELSGWSAQIGSAQKRLRDTQKRLHLLAQGGTAVGTGINTPSQFGKLFAVDLSKRSGLALKPNASFFESISSQDTAVELSGQLKCAATAIMKIANDLRWMNSGPLAGLGEIELKALQPGSSIMPGKVNPVIPESAAMAAAQVIGNDTTITIAGQSGNFQLNVMLPVMAYNLLQSIELLANTANLLADKAIASFKINAPVLKQNLHRNPILVTALNLVIGYSEAAKIAKKAYKEGRPVLDVAEEMTDLSRKELEKLLDPRKLTKPGK